MKKLVALFKNADFEEKLVWTHLQTIVPIKICKNYADAECRCWSGLLKIGISKKTPILPGIRSGNIWFLQNVAGST